MIHPIGWHRRTALLLALLLASIAASAFAQTKPRIERAADLPRFSYRIDGQLEDILRSGERFAPLAAQIRRDAASVLDGYEIADKATRRGLVSTLALVDFLDGRYADAERGAQALRALQDKPADKLLSGLRLEIMSRAAQASGLNTDAYRLAVAAEITKALDGMPYPVIGNDIKEAKAGAELIGEALVLGRAREVWQPIVAATGTLSSEFAPGLVGSRFALVGTLPLKQTLVETYSRYLDAHQVTKPDIWAARDVALPPGKNHPPVRIAVWDSGVDTGLYSENLARSAEGEPAVIAHDKYSKPVRGELMQLSPALKAKLPQMAARTKGFSDLQSNIDSAEASEVKQFLSTLSAEQYKPAIEELSLAGNYEHGTHVAGIALAGNPYARLVVGRITFGWTLKPDPCPSVAQAKVDAKAAQATVDFFKRERVRVVNMSWGGSVKGIEGDLEQCGVGKTPADRKALARRIFDIGAQSLTQAFAGAPGILFITAAGNSDSDASFVEDIPAGIVLPNLLTVGAVDRAGDEASFTSYGPTVKVAANGYQVESYLPGGQRVALSGTSMASPQVANLAAKILAVAPAMTPKEVIQLIVETADTSDDGRRHLIDPKQALARAGYSAP